MLIYETYSYFIINQTLYHFKNNILKKNHVSPA